MKKSIIARRVPFWQQNDYCIGQEGAERLFLCSGVVSLWCPEANKKAKLNLLPFVKFTVSTEPFEGSKCVYLCRNEEKSFYYSFDTKFELGSLWQGESLFRAMEEFIAPFYKKVNTCVYVNVSRLTKVEQKRYAQRNQNSYKK